MCLPISRASRPIEAVKMYFQMEEMIKNLQEAYGKEKGIRQRILLEAAIEALLEYEKSKPAEKSKGKFKF